jgi:hypothetical protein
MYALAGKERGWFNEEGRLNWESVLVNFSQEENLRLAHCEYFAWFSREGEKLLC